MCIYIYICISIYIYSNIYITEQIGTCACLCHIDLRFVQRVLQMDGNVTTAELDELE